MVTAHMTACPLPFGQLLPHFLGLFVGSALVAADFEALRAMRPKRWARLDWGRTAGPVGATLRLPT